ncbi:type VI secretion system tip protein TssI/VgrG [Edaphovirga cremea]|uniref:type VI secretion system tip protein TssI/VgrG n=1 Tax=Edaphovirga cremea TaxID=2267246 RepID=UPI003989DC48
MNGLVFRCKIGDQPDRTFAVASFTVNEGLSQLFTANLLLVSSNPDIALRQQLMQKASLTVMVDGIEQRTLSGRIASFEQGRTGNHYTYYTAVIRPELWALTLTQDSRIFHFKSVPEILSELLAKHRIICKTQYMDQHDVREFVTQKRETDYDFFCRLAAEEGIAFWVTNDGLMCSDSHLGMTAGIDMVYNPQPAVTTGDIISQISLRENMRPNEAVHKDRVYHNPDYALTHTARPESDTDGNPYSIFDSYGRFQDDGAGSSFTQYRLEQHQSDSTSGVATSNCFKLTPGKIFTVARHPAQKMNNRWQVVTITHQGHCPQALEEGSSARGTTLTNELTFIPGTIDWRPPHRYKPIADGDEVATVVGPANEEIYVNEDGAIRVHFHWNRYDQGDDRASCWVRVAQAWNGDGYGFLATPRIGQEVIISYLNGDVDRPIVTGTTYNGLNRPPLDLPAKKTQSTWRSKTYKGSGFNEFRFDDATQNEQIYMHAEKDHVTEILHDQSHTIGNNRTKSVGVDQKESIGRDKRTEVGRDHYETISRNSVIKVAQDQEIQVEQNRTLVVNSSEKKTIYADSIDDIGGNKTIEIQGVKDEKVNTKVFTRSKTYIIHGEDKTVLAGPGGSLTIDGSGVTIKAKKLTILTPSMDIKGGGVDQIEALTATIKTGKPFCEICAKAKKELEDAANDK